MHMVEAEAEATRADAYLKECQTVVGVLLVLVLDFKVVEGAAQRQRLGQLVDHLNHVSRD